MTNKELYIPLLETLEKYEETVNGLHIWKNKETIITNENLLEKTFFLSTDLAKYFGFLHKNVLQNIRKLQKMGYLSKTLPKFIQMIETNLAKRPLIIYALTRHQTERFIMDLSGPKARKKKFEILMRLQEIEADVLKGAFLSAQRKAQTWNGVHLLREYRFNPSVNGEFATKRDIRKFLSVPMSTLNNFLSKYHTQIQPIKLDIKTIRKIGSKANRMYAYKLSDVFKIAFWMDTQIGSELKKKIFGEFGLSLKNETTREIEWKKTFLEIFAGFNLKYHAKIGKYTVDYLVEDLDLVLECDENSHKHYDAEKEEERNKFITQKYILIRFDAKIRLETLINAILKAKPGELVKVYLNRI